MFQISISQSNIPYSYMMQLTNLEVPHRSLKQFPTVYSFFCKRYFLYIQEAIFTIMPKEGNSNYSLQYYTYEIRNLNYEIKIQNSNRLLSLDISYCRTISVLFQNRTEIPGKPLKSALKSAWNVLGVTNMPLHPQ